MFQCLRSKIAMVLTVGFQIVGQYSARLGKWAMDRRDSWAARV